MFFLIGTILLIAGSTLLVWNAKNTVMDLPSRPLMYSTNPIFGISVSIAAILMMLASLVFFWKVSHIIVYIIIAVAAYVIIFGRSKKYNG